LYTIETEERIEPRFLSNVLEAFLEPDAHDYAAFMHYQIPTLVDYLQRSHISYREKRLPETLQLVHHLLQSDPMTKALMLLLRDFVNAYRQELLLHFAEEETLLFPYALALHDARANGRSIDRAFNGYASEKFLVGHKHLNNSLGEVRHALRGYANTERRLSPCHILLQQLKSLEQDLRVHELIEERVLVPKLIALENGQILTNA